MTLETLLSYRLSDLILFTPDVYVRQFELINQQWDWLAFTAMALIVIGAVALRNRQPLRLMALGLIMASASAWMALAFFAERFAPIFTAMTVFTWLFAVNALISLMILPTLVGSRPRLNTTAGWLLLAWSLVGHPASNWLLGRPMDSLEWFGLAPEPTAFALLGFSLLSAHPSRWLLVPIPLLWCLSAIALHVGMHSPLATISPAAAIGIWAAAAFIRPLMAAPAARKASSQPYR